MPKVFPLEFRRDVVAVARKGEAPLSQIAKDFGISESCLHRWRKLADIDDGVRPGTTSGESAELRRHRARTDRRRRDQGTGRPAVTGESGGRRATAQPRRIQCALSSGPARGQIAQTERRTGGICAPAHARI